MTKTVSLDEKREFLRSQNWPCLENGRFPTGLWRDPKTMIDTGGGKVHSVNYPTAKAYKLAYKRKVDREARALRKAGYYRESGYGWRKPGYCVYFKTHAEAVRSMQAAEHAEAALPALKKLAERNT